MIFYSCSTAKTSENSVSINDLEVIKINLSEARKGKLSEFFEPMIEYIWLKDDSEDAQLSAGLHKIHFYKDKILTLDIYGCHCIKVFNKSGQYLSKIRAYGEGPGKYLDLDNFMVVNDEVLVMGVYPPKLIWFSLEGDFLREEKLKSNITAGVFLDSLERYHFSISPYSTEKYIVHGMNSDFRDTTNYFPTIEGRYYGDFSGRNNYILSGEDKYFTLAFQDTVFKLKGDKYIPKLVFDFGKYRQDLEEFKRKLNEVDPMVRLDFLNKKSKLYFVPNSSLILSEKYFFSSFMYEGISFNVFYDRKKQETTVWNWGIENDLDEGYNPYTIQSVFDEGRHAGLRISGVELFDILEMKREELGNEAFENYIQGKGKRFAEVATAAKESENPVLIIYTVKK